MKITPTDIDEVLIIEPQVFADSRGWFIEIYSKQRFQQQYLNIDFVQDNHSLSVQKGTLRGLHFQINPKAQTKLVRCTRGSILDVAVDLRKGSGTFKKWVAVELSQENKKQLLVPKGFAHGFITLTDNAEVEYKVDEFYNSECDRSIRFDDPQIGIDWGNNNPILSQKDLNAPLLRDSDVNFKIKVLVTGVNGQLGSDVVKSLNNLNMEVVASSRDDFDIANREQTRKFIVENKPNIVIHCGAYTAVDKAEDDQELCYLVNVEGTKNIAQVAKDIGAKLVYISTDYVFDGKGTTAHLEEDNTNPINYYGYTKEQGEKVVRGLIERHFIIRTSWVYGSNGSNFVKTMLRLAKSKNEVTVVDDQIGSPTYTKDLANFIGDLIQTNNYGTYHGVNEGYCSWYKFAQEIFEKAGIEMNVKPISSDEYITKAKRPKNSRLSKDNIDRAGLKRLPSWQDALDRYLKEI